MCNNYNKSQRPCLYLLMGFNIYLGPLVKVEGTILLIDVDMERFPLYIYVQTPWVEHTKATTRKPLVWESKVVKIDFSFSFRLCYLRRLNPADCHVHHTWSLPHRPCHHPSRFARVAIDIAVDCTAATRRAQPSAWPR